MPRDWRGLKTMTSHTLIALSRISNTSCSREWRRLLCVGLAASLLLHAVLFDWWRGRAASLPGPDARPALRVRFAPPPPLPVLPPVSAALREEAPRPARAPLPAVRPAAAPVTERVTETGSESPGVLPVLHSAEVPLAGLSGLRPLTPAEGRVAYRLALAAAPEPLPGVPLSGILLELEVQADGLPAEVRVLRGSGAAGPDQVWQDWARRAAARVAVPEVLGGRYFSVELEFLP